MVSKRYLAWLTVATALLFAACALPVETHNAPVSPAAQTTDSAIVLRQTRDPRFYKGRDYGTEAEFNPATEIINEGFDILQTTGEDRHIFARDYGDALHNVLRSVWHFDETYRAYGVANAARNEWFPLTGEDGRGGGAWVPNYEYHLVGSGMVSVRMEEWFEAHGVPHPALASTATLMAAHLLNEVAENGTLRTLNEDATTDLLIFDPAGLLLWRLDAVQRAFSGPVELTNWPGQASLDLRNHTLQNMGQQFVLRAPVPRLSRLKLFYDFGMTSLLGLSYVTANGNGLSIGAGADAVDNPVVDSTTNAKGATLKFKSGVFYDRGGSLLFSVLVGSRRDLAIDANFYPGLAHFGDMRPGLWFQVPKAGGVRLGMVSRWGLGIGT